MQNVCENDVQGFETRRCLTLTMLIELIPLNWQHDYPAWYMHFVGDCNMSPVCLNFCHFSAYLFVQERCKLFISHFLLIFF
jgi:hypothetical protein